MPQSFAESSFERVNNRYRQSDDNTNDEEHILNESVTPVLGEETLERVVESVERILKICSYEETFCRVHQQSLTSITRRLGWERFLVAIEEHQTSQDNAECDPGAAEQKQNNFKSDRFAGTRKWVEVLVNGKRPCCMRSPTWWWLP